MHRTLRPRSRTLVAIRLLILFCVLWLPFRSPPVVSATTHTVTVTDDEPDDPVDGSLRKAIQEAASGDTII